MSGWLDWRWLPDRAEATAELTVAAAPEDQEATRLTELVAELLSAGAARVETRIPVDATSLLAAAVQAGLRREGVVRTSSGPDLALLGRLSSDVDPATDALPTIASSMPTVLRAAGWYLRDPDDRVLMVDPVYKPGLDLPGGVCDPGEDLYATARRELLEELDLRLDPGDLLILDLSPANARRGDIELALVDGGVHPAEFVDDLRFPDGELSAARWVHPDDLDGLGPDSLIRRIRAAHSGFLDGRLPGPTILLRDGHPA